MTENGVRLVLVYDGRELKIHGGKIPASLAVWMLETAKVALVSGRGKKQPINIEGLDLSPLNPRKLS